MPKSLHAAGFRKSPSTSTTRCEKRLASVMARLADTSVLPSPTMLLVTCKTLRFALMRMFERRAPSTRNFSAPNPRSLFSATILKGSAAAAETCLSFPMSMRAGPNGAIGGCISEGIKGGGTGVLEAPARAS